MIQPPKKHQSLDLQRKGTVEEDFAKNFMANIIYLQQVISHFRILKFRRLKYLETINPPYVLKADGPHIWCVNNR